jgi:hypothetical protein
MCQRPSNRDSWFLYSVTFEIIVFMFGKVEQKSHLVSLSNLLLMAVRQETNLNTHTQIKELFCLRML